MLMAELAHGGPPFARFRKPLVGSGLRSARNFNPLLDNPFFDDGICDSAWSFKDHTRIVKELCFAPELFWIPEKAHARQLRRLY
jgi:hypothetical protein